MVPRLVLILPFFLMPATAFAHDVGQHVFDTVIAIDEKRIEAKTLKETAVSVKLTKQVRFKGKSNPESTKPPAVGNRVVIEATKENMILTATEVHSSVAKNAPVTTQ